MARQLVYMSNSQLREWWIKKVGMSEAPAFATAAIELKPETISVSEFGDFFSAVFDDRTTRVYCFENQSNRDRFLTRYRKVYRARPVTRPYC